MLKSLWPSLVLITIYFIADTCFGAVVGVCTALVLGIAEFIYTRIREKVYDRLILWTTLFFCIPGLFLLWPEQQLSTLLQPVLVEAALVVIIGIFAFSRTDITATLPVSYRKNLKFSRQQQQGMRQIMSFLFILLCLHLSVAIVATMTFEGAILSFINGPLLYILLGGYLLFLYIRSRYLLHRLKKEEWLPLVNEQGEVIGKAPRSVCHNGSQLLHPVVHLHIFNDKQEIFLQKRSMKKDLLPGYWDTAVGGHIGWNEKVEDALKRETYEELGITDFDARFLGNYVWESSREKELVFSFLCTQYNRVNIVNDEVDEGRFWSKKEIEQGISNRIITPNFAHEYAVLLKKILN